jgi:hypothetical protein
VQLLPYQGTHKLLYDYNACCLTGLLPRAAAEVGLGSSVGVEIVWLIFSSKVCLPAVAVQPADSSMLIQRLIKPAEGSGVPAELAASRILLLMDEA